MNTPTYRFGEFQLMPATRELWHAGQRVSVQPKVFDTLAYLLQHRDRAVGRDELISAVWGRLDITDNVLSQIVARARHAVGDTTREAHTIRTVPRFGYRWIRDVDTDPASIDPAAGPPFTPPATLAVHRTSRPRTRAWTRRRPFIAAALGLLCVVGLSADRFAPVIGSHDTPLPLLREAIASHQLDRAHALFRALSDGQRTQPEVRYEAAVLALEEGHFEDAFRAFKTLLFDLGEHGPPALVGPALYGAGQAAFRRGLRDVAEPYLKQATDVLPKAGSTGRVTLGLTWTLLGRLYSTRKLFNQADHAYAQARSVLEGVGDAATLAQLESNVGVTEIARYRYAEALPRFQHAADLAAQTHDANTEARARMNLVNAQLVLLQSSAALGSEPRLRALRDEVGDPVLAADIDLIRAKALTANGRLTEAALALRAASARPAPDDETLAAIRHITAARLAFAQGALDTGTQAAHALLTSSYDASEDDGVTAYALWQWLEASKASGDARGMAEAAAAADARHRAHPDEPTLALYAALAQAETADARDDLATARPAFERALALADATRVPFDQVRVVASYTQFLLRHGHDADASVVAERIAGWAGQDYTAALVQLNVYHATGSEAWPSALARAQALAGERTLPTALTRPPRTLPLDRPRVLLASDLL